MQYDLLNVSFIKAVNRLCFKKGLKRAKLPMPLSVFNVLAASFMCQKVQSVVLFVVRYSFQWLEKSAQELVLI